MLKLLSIQMMMMQHIYRSSKKGNKIDAVCVFARRVRSQVLQPFPRHLTKLAKLIYSSYTDFENLAYYKDF